jgi:hypothetical protein
MNPLIIKMNFAKKSKNPKNYHGSLYLSISCYIGHELVVDGFFFFFFLSYLILRRPRHCPAKANNNLSRATTSWPLVRRSLIPMVTGCSGLLKPKTAESCCRSLSRRLSPESEAKAGRALPCGT